MQLESNQDNMKCGARTGALKMELEETVIAS